MPPPIERKKPSLFETIVNEEGALNSPPDLFESILEEEAPSQFPPPRESPRNIIQPPPQQHLKGGAVIAEGYILRNRLRLLQSLGEGWLGRVFLAEDVFFGGRYAVKILHKHFSYHQDFIHKFIQEFHKIECLYHPGIVNPYALDSDDETQEIFYRMEFLSGKTLKHELEERTKDQTKPPFDSKEIISFLESMATILTYAHKNKTIHRNLKPSNIFLLRSKEGLVIKILDFGFSKHLNRLNSPLLSDHFGSLYYVAPELQSGEESNSPTSDVFAMGVILYHMLTGSLPVGMSPPPSKVFSQFPQKLDRVLAKAMHMHWQNRHPSVNDLLSDVRNALSPKGQVVQLTL